MTEAIYFRHRFVMGWPEPEDPKERVEWFDDTRCLLAPVTDILTQRLSTDAHFVAYTADVTRRHAKRLFQSAENAALIPSVNVRMVLAVFDVDAPDHVVTDEWIASEEPKICLLDDAHPNGFVYLTRGGYRLVYALPEPYPLRSQADDDAWTARYLTWCRYLRRRFDIAADEACSDWTRFYRAPFVTRDGVRQEPETFGDPSTLGTWAPRTSKRDAMRPKTLERTHYGAVEPVPIADPNNEYGQRRIAAAIEYLKTAPLGIEGQHGRDTFFKPALYLMRRLRLPLDVAADCVEAIYNPRLRDAGTTTWDRDELEDRLVSARNTGKVPPGDVMSEELWREIRRAVA